MSNVNRNTTFRGGPPGNRTLNLRIKSPLLCLIELATRRRSLATARPGPALFKNERATDRIRTGDILDHNQVL